jgi:hypothetical protein
MALRKSMGIIWSPSRRRGVKDVELLTAMGWCVDRKTAKKLDIPFLNVNKRAGRIGKVNYRALCGNAMHLAARALVSQHGAFSFPRQASPR